MTYNAAPLNPASYRVLINEQVKNRQSWGFHAIEGFYIGTVILHYRNITVFPRKMRSIRTSDAVEFRHSYIIVPKVTPEDKVVDAIAKLETDLIAILAPNSDDQLIVIEQIREVLGLSVPIPKFHMKISWWLDNRICHVSQLDLSVWSH